MQQLVTLYRRSLFSLSISEMSNLRDGGSGELTEISNASRKGHSKFQGRATDRRGRERGAKANAANPTLSAGDRPTHCRLHYVLHIHYFFSYFLFSNLNSSCSSSGAWISCASLTSRSLHIYYRLTLALWLI